MMLETSYIFSEKELAFLIQGMERKNIDISALLFPETPSLAMVHEGAQSLRNKGLVQGDMGVLDKILAFLLRQMAGAERSESSENGHIFHCAKLDIALETYDRGEAMYRLTPRQREE